MAVYFRARLNAEGGEEKEQEYQAKRVHLRVLAVFSNQKSRVLVLTEDRVCAHTCVHMPLYCQKIEMVLKWTCFIFEKLLLFQKIKLHEN